MLLLMMTPQTVMRESEERGEEKDVEGSTSTNVLVYDVIDTIKHVDNDYTIAEAVVVRLFTLLCYRSLLHLVWWQRFGISNHHSNTAIDIRQVPQPDWN